MRHAMWVTFAVRTHHNRSILRLLRTAAPDSDGRSVRLGSARRDWVDCAAVQGCTAAQSTHGSPRRRAMTTTGHARTGRYHERAAVVYPADRGFPLAAAWDQCEERTESGATSLRAVHCAKESHK